VVQYGESDAAFLHRLMERDGVYYYYEHDSGSHKLVFTDSTADHVAATGYENVPYFPPNSNLVRDQEYFDDWRVGHSVRSGAAAYAAFDFTRPRVDLSAESKVTKAAFKLGSPGILKHSDLEVFEYSRAYLQAADGDHYVREELDRSMADNEVVHGNGNVRGIGVGYTFTLENLPREDQNREYLVTGADYTLVVNRLESGDGNNVDFNFSMTAIPASGTFRLPRETPWPRIRGPQTAIVVGPSGKEIWTDEYGRVKVHFHWDREGKKDENDSCWIRVSQIWAGAKWGAMHIPRIGQEVIVEFLDGDPDQPIITGRVYNADNMPPYPLSKNQTQSGIKSHSTEKGGANEFNEFRFEDKKGEEHIYMQAQKDLLVLVKHDVERKVENDRREEVVANETITIGKNRTEEVGENETITIKGERKELVEKDETIEVKGSRTETVTKDETLSFKANRIVSVDADETITVKANQTETVDGKQTVTVKGDVVRDLKAKETVEVASDLTQTIGGKLALSVGGNASEDFSGNLAVSVGGKTTHETTGAVTIKSGAKLVLEGTSQVQLKCGGASITLKSSGDVEIKGVQVKVEGSAKVDVKGAAVGVKGMITLG
jgi:type VI secretion system secreted protein VgrG